MNQKILPVVKDFKTLEYVIRGPQTWCVLMDFHVNFMEDVITQLHDANKKALVHMDLVKGIQNDVFGTQFMCQKLHADGIISTKAKSIETALQNHVLAILRVFVLDSKSLLRGAQMAAKLHPDYVEVLPGVIPHVVSMMQQYCDIPIIGGGLIKTKEDIDKCLQQGMKAITTSHMELCEWENSI